VRGHGRHALRGGPGSRVVPRPHELLPRTGDLRFDGSIGAAGLAPGAVPLPRPERALADGVLRDPAEPGRRDRGSDGSLAPVIHLRMTITVAGDAACPGSLPLISCVAGICGPRSVAY